MTDPTPTLAEVREALQALPPLQEALAVLLAETWAVLHDPAWTFDDRRRMANLAWVLTDPEAIVLRERLERDRRVLRDIVDVDHPGSEDGNGGWRCPCPLHVDARAILAIVGAEPAAPLHRKRPTEEALADWLRDQHVTPPKNVAGGMEWPARCRDCGFTTEDPDAYHGEDEEVVPERTCLMSGTWHRWRNVGEGFVRFVYPDELLAAILRTGG